MKIAASNMQMNSAHQENQQYSLHTKLSQRSGQARQTQSDTTDAALTRFSQQAKTLTEQSTYDKTLASHKTSGIGATMDSTEGDPMLSLMRGILERMFGVSIPPFDASVLTKQDLQNSQTSATSSQMSVDKTASESEVSYEYTQHYEFSETSNFSTQGSVQTTDGRTIDFQFSMSMVYQFSESRSLQVQSSEPAKKQDPLMLNFFGQAAQLSDKRFELDLNNDGVLDKAHFAAQGSGFLVFDRNTDGRVNDGSELFGPSTGQGFAELAEHDSDQNGWIDENDPIYAQLRIWQNNPEGEEELILLKTAKVGAIALDHVSTPFAIKDGQNQNLGDVRSSGIYLKENGQVGAVQQIDLRI